MELTEMGINYAAGFVWGLLVEWIPQFDQLPPKTKRLAMAIIAGLVSAVVLVINNAGQLSGLDPTALLNAFVTGLLAGFGGSQTAHGLFYLGKES